MRPVRSIRSFFRSAQVTCSIHGARAVTDLMRGSVSAVGALFELIPLLSKLWRFAVIQPALVPQARCERIAVISCAIEARTAKLGSTSHTVNAERGRVCGAPQKTHPRFLGTPVPPLQEPPA